MGQAAGIGRELNFFEVITQTFELYSRNFLPYFLLFLVIEAVDGLLNIAVRQAVNLPDIAANPTPDQLSSWVSNSLGPLLAAGLALLLIAIVVFPIALGATIRMASEEIQNGRSEVMPAVNFAASKLLPMWAVGIIAGLLIFVGFIAFIIPGIILVIMFCLVFPALLIENAGVFGSLARSRELVGGRWLKTFVTFLVLFIIIVIISAILGLIAAPFGSASGFVNTLLGAFTAPLVPIAITVYYYSNLARTSPGQAAQPIAPTAPMPQSGVRFCVSCGTQMPATSVYCPKCGTRQP